jgi:transcriptional regulator with XRE-family HTH domain
MTDKLQPRKTKRPMTAREMAEKFNVDRSTITRWWSQTRADYLAENSISRDKPWEHFGISRATWYRRGKPMPSEIEKQEQSA